MIAGFSNLPGEYPDQFIFAPGKNIPVRGIDDKISLGSGASFASPFVGGVLVLLGKYFPELSMTQIRKAVLNSAAFFYDPAFPQTPENPLPKVYGRGKISPYAAFLLCTQMVKETSLANPQALNSQLQKFAVTLKKQMHDLSEEKEKKLQEILNDLMALRTEQEMVKHFPGYREVLEEIKTEEGKQRYLKDYLEAGFTEEEAIQDLSWKMRNLLRTSTINQIYDLLQPTGEATTIK